MGEETYTCPNCGAISPIHVLEEEGCPYCRTGYLITDLFPKVTNYYFHVPDISAAWRRFNGCI